MAAMTEPASGQEGPKCQDEGGCAVWAPLVLGFGREFCGAHVRRPEHDTAMGHAHRRVCLCALGAGVRRTRAMCSCRAIV